MPENTLTSLDLHERRAFVHMADLTVSAYAEALMQACDDYEHDQSPRNYANVHSKVEELRAALGALLGEG